MVLPFISLFALIGITPAISNISNDNVSPINPIFISSTLNNAIESTYHFRFNEAESFISKIDSASETDKEVAYLNQTWWMGLTYDGKSETLKSLENYSLKLQTKYSEPKTSQELFIKVLAGTYLIRIGAINGDKALALKALIRISSDFKKILKDPTNNQEYMLLAGVYNYAAGGIKQSLYWLKPFFIFLPTPNIQLGKLYLTECTKSQNNIISTEARYFLYKIENDIYKSKKNAKNHIDWLVNKYPDNLVYAIDQLKLEKELGEKTQPLKSEMTAKIQKSVLTKKQQDHFLMLLNKIK